jgi:hypothetical protein
MIFYNAGYGLTKRPLLHRRQLISTIQRGSRNSPFPRKTLISKSDALKFRGFDTG